jgi:hypothetical protein
MKTATSLGLIAVGAILALAISARPSFPNLHAVGWILIMTGAAGLVVPRGTRILRRERARWGVGPARRKSRAPSSSPISNGSPRGSCPVASTPSSPMTWQGRTTSKHSARNESSRRQAMRTATGLAIVALGAVLAFAINGHPSYFNIQVAGWVVMLTGVRGIVIPRRGYGWMRTRLTYQRRPRPVSSHAGTERDSLMVTGPGIGDIAGEATDE